MAIEKYTPSEAKKSIEKALLLACKQPHKVFHLKEKSRHKRGGISPIGGVKMRSGEYEYFLDELPFKEVWEQQTEMDYPKSVRFLWENSEWNERYSASSITIIKISDESFHQLNDFEFLMPVVLKRKSIYSSSPEYTNKIFYLAYQPVIQKGFGSISFWDIAAVCQGISFMDWRPSPIEEDPNYEQYKSALQAEEKRKATNTINYRW